MDTHTSGPYRPGSLDERLAPYLRPSFVLFGALLLALVGFARPQGSNPPPAAPATQTQVWPLTGSMGTADSNRRMIAVAGVDVTGSSILYVIDTYDPAHVAVYQASSGSGSSQGLKLIGVRRIDLDLRLDGFNDRSEHKYKDLEREFADSGLLDPPAAPR